MVQRARETREGAKRAPSRREQSQPLATVPDTAQEIIQLEAERDRLKASLERAEARIAELEQTRAVVVNRIDWLIDSLGGAIEKRM
jgi:hypothetical protein